jgi:hypothetical protein
LVVLIALLALAGSVVTAAAQSVAASLPGASDSSHGIHWLVTADVSDVDQRTGLLLLKTDAGRLTFEAPADVTSALRKGDRVIVELALRHPGSTVVRSERSPHPLFARRLSGEVAAVNRTVGVVALATSAGRVNMELALATVAGLRTGDRIALDTAVFSDGDVAASATVQPRIRGAAAALLFMLFGRPR